MTTPLWFIIIGAIVLVAFILFQMFVRGPLSNVLGLLTGAHGGCGCIIGIIAGILCGGILIWYILSDLFF